MGDTSKLKNHITDLYRENQKKKKGNLLSEIKKILPKQKSRINGLLDEHNILHHSSNQDSWPKIIKNYWGNKIWKKQASDPNKILKLFDNKNSSHLVTNIQSIH